MEKIVEKNEFFEELRNLCIENANGFTKAVLFDKNNNIKLDSNVDGRYIASFTNYTLVDFKNKKAEDIMAELYAFLVQNLDLLHEFKRFTIGGWYDKSNGKYYVDLGVAVDNLNSALDIAKRHNQKAIFDLQELKEIFV